MKPAILPIRKDGEIRKPYLVHLLMLRTQFLDTLPKTIILPLLKSISFYRNVLDVDQQQTKFILQYSKIFELEPGETIIRKGEFDNWFYFILKGQLLVYPEDENDSPIAYLPTGEMFGELAVVRDLMRMTTVVGDPNCKKILLLGTDFSPFGDLDDSSNITVDTKIVFYKSVIEVTERRIEIIRSDFPKQTVERTSKEESVFSGKKGTMEELNFLHKKAEGLIQELSQLNLYMGSKEKSRVYLIKETVDYIKEVVG